MPSSGGKKKRYGEWHSLRRRHTSCYRLERALPFFHNDTATTEIYTLSLHDALPITVTSNGAFVDSSFSPSCSCSAVKNDGDRKSTRLNSSHVRTSYAVVCLKKA